MYFLSRRSMHSGILGTGVLALSLATAACEENPTTAPRDTGTFYGEPVTVGNGNVRTYVTLNEGSTVELGLAFSEQGLTNLPAHGHGEGPHGNTVEYLLDLPEGHGTPFKFIELNWNPAGHEPEGIYTLPHFDFHFYSISLAERNAIDPSDPQFAQKANNVPGAEYLPEGYIHTGVPMGAPPAGAAVPRMGVHWIDPTSPELNGETFTTTFIYGSWDGKLIFAEPMITKSLIESKPNLTLPIKTPQKHAVAGRHPGAYRIYWEATKKEYRVALSGFADYN